jgi:NTE family protein
MSRKKVGLALGGGAARGLAHIGVLEVLEREGIPIDMIAGTSMGAVVGAFYAYTKDLDLMKNLAVEFGLKRLRLFTDLTLPRTGLLSWKRVEDSLKGVIGGVKFEDLKIPFTCVAVDIDNGEEVILNRGSVWEAARASATIPVILSLKQYQGRYLVDGGILDPVPVSAVKKMGADFIIAVNVIPKKIPVETREPNIINIMFKSVYLFSHKVTEASFSGADVVIEPDTGSIAYTDFHHARECFKIGATAAQNSLAEIKRKLEIS